jgi:hypothetical protein
MRGSDTDSLQAMALECRGPVHVQFVTCRVVFSGVSLTYCTKDNGVTRVYCTKDSVYYTKGRPEVWEQGIHQKVPCNPRRQVILWRFKTAVVKQVQHV